MPSSTNEKGDSAEAHIIAALIDAGKTVLRPIGAHLRFDLLIEDENAFFKVQCKCGRLRNGRLKFNSSSRGRGKARSYLPTDVDFFAVYCPELKKSYLIPYSICKKHETALNIGLEPHSTLYFATTFELLVRQ